MGYGSKQFLHGHKQLDHLIHRGEGSKVHNQFIHTPPIKQQRLNQLIEMHVKSNVIKGLKIPTHINKRKTILNQIRTQQPFEESLVFNEIENQEVSNLNILLIDVSNSMKKPHYIHAINKMIQRPYDLILLHREQLFELKVSQLTKDHFIGGTSFLKPIKMLYNSVHSIQAQVKVDHISDGFIHGVELSGLVELLSQIKNDYELKLVSVNNESLTVKTVLENNDIKCTPLAHNMKE
ncbi:hypothetical protein [Alkalibacillus silvisoli]|uniref:Uncharacterized protein n=1 Tax=Alkalibacillus silvisoli TaxID=392823 RepID=A0ABN1A9D2_9BACI